MTPSSFRTIRNLLSIFKTFHILSAQLLWPVHIFGLEWFVVLDISSGLQTILERITRLDKWVILITMNVPRDALMEIAVLGVF